MKMLHQLPILEIRDAVAPIGDDGRKKVIAASIICITIATVAVALRLSARRLTKAKVMADDYAIIVVLVRARIIGVSNPLSKPGYTDHGAQIYCIGQVALVINCMLLSSRLPFIRLNFLTSVLQLFILGLEDIQLLSTAYPPSLR